MQKQKNLSSQLKKVTQSIQSNRKNIQSNVNIIQNISDLRKNFGQIQGIIKGRASLIQGIKSFSKQQTNETSKNLQSKRIFTLMLQRFKVQIKSYFELMSENLLLSYKQPLSSIQSPQWQKIIKEVEKSLIALQQESQTTQQMFQAIQKMNTVRQNIIGQMIKLMIYQKNMLWRDLNAPYDDYIHGQVKAILNQMKSNEQKLGYIPGKLKFQMPKFTTDQKNDTIQLFKIHLGDFSELVQGLKNYSKLSGQEQIIEDISKNQHIVKGLRERIERLTINYQSLMQKYRNLQISKGKLNPTQEKSLTQRVQQLETFLNRKQQELIEQKQLNLKNQSTIQSLRDKNKDIEEQLSKFQKTQQPKIKQLELNHKSLQQQFVKVKRDLETYSNIVNQQRQEKLKLVDDLKAEKKRVNDLAFILGRQRRNIKQLKQEINRKQQIIMELVDKNIPNQILNLAK